MKENNHAKYGCCISCGKNLIIDAVVGKEVIKKTSSEYIEEEYLLDDCSRMRVVFCKPCCKEIEEKDYKEIMKRELNGWKEEIRNLKWTDQKKKDYIEKYSKKSIICKSKDLDNDTIIKEYLKYKEKNNGSDK